MKIKDLILELKKHDPEARVCMPGYEGGMYYPMHVVPVTLALDVNTAWYYGPHEQVVPELDEDYPGYEHQVAIKIC